MDKRVRQAVLVFTICGIQLAIVSQFLSRSCNHHKGEQNRGGLLATDETNQVPLKNISAKMLKRNINTVGKDMMTMRRKAQNAKDGNYKKRSYLDSDRVLDQTNFDKSETMSHLKSSVCVADETQRKMKAEHGVCILNVAKLAETVEDTECVHLNFQNPTPICIYDPRFDRVVSGYVFSIGMWENAHVNIFIEALNQIEDIVVLDIGCNIGVYTLTAAKNGYHVVAIDANVENLRLLSKSLVLGDLTEKVTLIWNAVSDTYTNVTLHPTDKNVAGYFIDTTKETISETEVAVKTMLLDDIQYLFQGKPVAIKIDIELHEIQALRGGLSFLESINVRFIHLEMKFHRTRKSGREIVQLLGNFGFETFHSCNGKDKLEHVLIEEWPVNVCFMK